MGMFDELRNLRDAHTAKSRASEDGQASAAAASTERMQRVDARAETEFAGLDQMVTQVLQELHAAVYPECEVRKDAVRLRWLLGIQPLGYPPSDALFEPVIVVAPLFDADGAAACLQCESTFATAFRERRSCGRVERTVDLSTDALAEALCRLHRR